MKNWLSAALLSAAFLLTGCSGAPAQGPETATFFAGHSNGFYSVRRCRPVGRGRNSDWLTGGAGIRHG